MADVLQNNNSGTYYFPTELVQEVVSKVNGKSSLAKLSNSKPVEFVGNDIFTFSIDKEMDVVGESGAKSKGGATIAPVTIRPVKIEYSTRLSDEFIKCAEEKRIRYLEAITDGLAKKIARAIDIMAFHGVNPRTGNSSSVIGNNHFDYVVDTNIITQDGTTTADEDVEAAIELIQTGDREVTGMAMAPAFKGALAKLVGDDGHRIYPDLAWGNAPSTINGLPIDSNSTVSFGGSLDLAIVGDFENMFRWGYAKDMEMEVIQYGNPDNDATLGDLKGHNQVLVRVEAYVGWGILDGDAFALIQAEEEDDDNGGGEGGGDVGGGEGGDGGDDEEQ